MTYWFNYPTFIDYLRDLTLPPPSGQGLATLHLHRFLGFELLLTLMLLFSANFLFNLLLLDEIIVAAIFYEVEYETLTVFLLIMLPNLLFLGKFFSIII